MVERNNEGTVTQVIYTPAGAKLGVMSGQTLDFGYVPLPGGAVAQYAANGGFYYRHPDWQGSTHLVTQEGLPWIFSDTAYSPFGYPYATSGSPDLSFTGMNQDTSGGLYDFPAREYEWSGRWPSPDPAGLAAVDPAKPQTWNRYAYVTNNPLASTDPLGMDQCDPDDPYGAGSGACAPCVLEGTCTGGGPGPLLPLPVPPIGGGGGGGGSPSSSGPTPIPEAPVDVGSPDSGMGTGPIWSEQVPIYSGPINPYLIIQNFANGEWEDWSTDDWDAFFSNLLSWQNAKQAQKDAYQKGYYACLVKKNVPGFSTVATMHAGTDVASETASHFAPQIARIFYHFTDARFTAWGKYSKVLVPAAAANIRLWMGRLNAAGWAYADYELAKSIAECSGKLE